MSHYKERLSFREKAGYSLGDAATNFFFQSMIMYQSRFYTDVMGISAVAAGWLFLLVRIFDAGFDPLVGVLSDRTVTRWGKFRPWVLWTAIPFGVVLWLTYTVPSFSSGGKVVYVFITYTLMMMMYSANNTPYSALNGVMTGDVNERTSLSTFRFVAAMAATLVVQGFTLPLVEKFGGKNPAHGWSMTFGIFGGIAIVFYVIAFFSAKERVHPDPEQKSSVIQDLKDVFHSPPWVVMFIITLCIFTTLALRGGLMFYYFTYYVDHNALLNFVKDIGLGNVHAGAGTWWTTALNWFGFILQRDGSNVTAVGFSIFNMAGNLVTIVGVLVSKPLSIRFGKKAVFLTGILGTAFITAAIFVLPATSIGWLLVLSLLWPVFYGPTIPLLWAMIADVADFSEWKTRRRATGMVYAGIVFALKAGLGLGGAIGGWLLASYGYVPNVAQSADALLGIRLCATLYPAIPFLLAFIAIAYYPISKELNLRIGDELAERRKAFAKA